MSIGMSHFKELYGYDALTFYYMIFGDSIDPKAKDWVEESKEILKLFKRQFAGCPKSEKKTICK